MRIMGVKSPCKDCKDRHEKCHTTCELYLEYREKLMQEREKRFKEDGLEKAIKNMNYSSINTKMEVPLPLRHGRRPKR